VRLGGDQKRKVTFELILDDLEQQGIKLSKSLVNAAIETAVIQIKEK
jgi:hypothetical protein